MIDRPGAFFAVDEGSATTSVALIGRVAGRWRLLGSSALPAGVPPDAIARLVLTRLSEADPDLAAELLGDPAATAVDLPRVVARTTPPATLAILAPTERRRTVLERAATGSGWRIESGSLERNDALALTSLALGHEVSALVVGAGAPPSPDEKRALRVLAPLVAGIVARRPDLAVVLVGGASQAEREVQAARPVEAGMAVMVAEGGGAGPSETVLRAALDDLRADEADSRRALVRATASLAAVLGRRVETVEIGHGGGSRVAAGRWVGRDDEPVLRSAIIAAAGLARADPDDVLLDGVVGWSSVPVDRPRLRDRLRELWLAPWAEAHGEGALLRLTAARAALDRLVAATPEFADLPSPDVLVVAGGVWSVAPPPAIGLAVMDVVRRAGVSQLLFDHARLLGPIGMIPDEGERRAVLTDLIDDAFVPLGTAITPHGLRSGRFVGKASVTRRDGTTVDHDLVAGNLITLDVPPGESATVELDFRDAVTLGGRGKRFAVEVAGGMGGVLVDLRDVPLRLPDRLERRRELLTAWQQPLWGPLEA